MNIEFKLDTDKLLTSIGIPTFWKKSAVAQAAPEIRSLGAPDPSDAMISAFGEAPSWDREGFLKALKDKVQKEKDTSSINEKMVLFLATVSVHNIAHDTFMIRDNPARYEHFTGKKKKNEFLLEYESPTVTGMAREVLAVALPQQREHVRTLVKEIADEAMESAKKYNSKYNSVQTQAEVWQTYAMLVSTGLKVSLSLYQEAQHVVETTPPLDKISYAESDREVGARSFIWAVDNTYGALQRTNPDKDLLRQITEELSKS